MIRTTAPSNPSNSVAAVFAEHSGAEKAVKELKDGGFDIKKLSIVGTDYHSEENVVGFYNTGDRMMYWGKAGAFWGGLWGLLFGSAFFLIPGLGPIIAAGPVVTWIIAALEGAEHGVAFASGSAASAALLGRATAIMISICMISAAKAVAATTQGSNKRCIRPLRIR